MAAEDILNAFMQQRWKASLDKRGLWTEETIERVVLDDWVDHGWSEYTPGDGWHLTVQCFVPGLDKHVHYEDHNEGDTIKFINELCQFAASVVGVADQ